MEPNPSPDDLDDDTKAAVETWLVPVLEAFAPESEPKIRQDVYRILAGRTEVHEGSIADLPTQSAFIRRYRNIYVTVDDRDWIGHFADVEKWRPNKFLLSVWSAMFIAMLIIFCRGLLTGSDVWANALGQMIIAVTMLFGYVLLPLAKRYLYRTIGPMACALINPAADIGLGLAALGALGLFLLNVGTLVQGKLPSLSFAYSTFAIVACTTAIIGILYWFRGYWKLRAKIQNNYDIVARILELPGHEEESTQASK